MGSTEQIKQKAVELGFDLVGVTDASPLKPEQVNQFINWLDAGYAGRMDWLHSNIEKRIKEIDETLMDFSVHTDGRKTKQLTSTSKAPKMIQDAIRRNRIR